jgi:hypothetical protein
MTSADSIVLRNTFGIDNLEYLNSQWEFIPDSNNTNYTSAQVRFDSIQWQSKFVDISDAFIRFPLTITPTVGAFSASPLIALKQSILSLLRGVSISMQGGKNIVNDNTNILFLYNHICQLLDNDIDWLQTNGSSLQFAKDRPTAGLRVSGLTTVANLTNPKVSLFTGAVSATANSLRSECNQGFIDRNAYLLDLATGTGTAGTAGVTVKVDIPLKYIHQFFAGLGQTVLFNMRMDISVTLNIGSSASYQPFCLGTLEAGTVETGTSVSTAVTTGNTCELWYRRVDFHPDQATAYRKMCEEGITRTIEFTELYPDVSRTNQTSTARQTQVIASSVTAPKRVFGLVYPTNVVNGVNWPGPCVTGRDVGLTNFQITLNGQPYLETPINDVAQWWDNLKAEMPLSYTSSGHNSILSYSDFVNTFRIHCINLERSQDRYDDPNALSTLTVSYQQTASTASDIVWLVECKRVVTVTYGASIARVVVGPRV